MKPRQQIIKYTVPTPADNCLEDKKSRSQPTGLRLEPSSYGKKRVLFLALFVSIVVISNSVFDKNSDITRNHWCFIRTPEIHCAFRGLAMSLLARKVRSLWGLIVFAFPQDKEGCGSKTSHAEIVNAISRSLRVFPPL